MTMLIACFTSAILTAAAIMPSQQVVERWAYMRDREK